MSEDDPSGWPDEAQELRNLRQFFYQCPVGLFEIDDDGRVNKVNPAAVAMLAPAIGDDDLAKLFPLLNRLAPQIVMLIAQDRKQMGALGAGQRMLIPAEVHGTSCLEIRAVRVSPGRVMIVLLDVSAEQRLAGESDRLFEAEKAAHEGAAAARDEAVAALRQEAAARLRLQALQAVTAGLATAVTSEQIADVLVEQGMNLLADHGAVTLLDAARTHLLTRATADFPATIARSYARIPVAQAAQTPVGQAALSGRRVVMTSLEEIAARCPLVASSHALTGTSSLVAVPVRVAGHSIGALGFGFRAAGPVSADSVAVAETLAELAGQALERARLYESEHAAAHQLQRALLPDVPAELPGAGIGVCYRAAERGRDVGGDWYDVFQISGERIGFAVGDVVGHDLVAAVAMGRLQQLLRYVAASGARPGEVLRELDDACPSVTGTEFATLGYAEYSPASGLLTYACAGHPPPLLIAGGHARYLNDGLSPPLGFGTGFRAEAQLAVTPGSMLVWYSDGLVERREEHIGRGLDRLAALAADHTGTDAQYLADSLLAGMTGGQFIGDDVVVACLHLRGDVDLP
jgi:Stage II sporulation protein E (SpoIIE)/GAF domain